jgi:hypothetical protein
MTQTREAILRTSKGIKSMKVGPDWPHKVGDRAIVTGRGFEGIGTVVGISGRKR